MPATKVRVFQNVDGTSPFMDWLDGLEASKPAVWKKCLYSLLALSQHGHELRRPMAAPLRDGIYELRPKKGPVHYRILYGFVGSHDAVVALGTTKEDVVDPKDIDIAIERLNLAQRDLDRYTVDFEI